MPLVLTRKLGEATVVQLGNKKCKITIVDIQYNKRVKLVFDAPPEVEITRPSGTTDQLNSEDK